MKSTNESSASPNDGAIKYNECQNRVEEWWDCLISKKKTVMFNISKFVSGQIQQYSDMKKKRKYKNLCHRH